VETILDGSATSEFYHAGPGDGRVSTYGNVSVVFDPRNLRPAATAEKSAK
jgi:hypothetical protein